MVLKTKGHYILIMIDFSKPRTLVLFTFLLLILAIIRISFYSDLNNFGINKTVGNAWEWVGLRVAASVLTILFSLLVYTVLWIYKLKVNKTFSLFNLSFLTGALGGFIGLNFSVIYGLYAVLILLMNITHAIAAKKNEKKKNLQ